MRCSSSSAARIISICSSVVREDSSSMTDSEGGVTGSLGKRSSSDR